MMEDVGEARTRRRAAAAVAARTTEAAPVFMPSAAAISCADPDGCEAVPDFRAFLATAGAPPPALRLRLAGMREGVRSGGGGTDFVRQRNSYSTEKNPEKFNYSTL